MVDIKRKLRALITMTLVGFLCSGCLVGEENSFEDELENRVEIMPSGNYLFYTDINDEKETPSKVALSFSKDTKRYSMSGDQYYLEATALRLSGNMFVLKVKQVKDGAVGYIYLIAEPKGNTLLIYGANKAVEKKLATLLDKKFAEKGWFSNTYVPFKEAKYNQALFESIATQHKKDLSLASRMDKVEDKPKVKPRSVVSANHCISLERNDKHRIITIRNSCSFPAHFEVCTKGTIGKLREMFQGNTWGMRKDPYYTCVSSFGKAKSLVSRIPSDVDYKITATK